MHAQLPRSINWSTYMGDCYSVMTILSFSTEQLLVKQSIKSAILKWQRINIA